MTDEQLKALVEFCKYRHDIYANQLYDEYELRLPYSYHLGMVAEQGERFKHLLKDDQVNLAIGGCWGHDLIEDTRYTYNDIKQRFGIQLAEIVYSCTEHKGKNPDQRKPIEFFTALRHQELGNYVKICDILANTTFSVRTGNRNMFKKSYKTFHDKVMIYMYIPIYKEMYDTLGQIYIDHKDLLT